jgi:hypothetical protein
MPDEILTTEAVAQDALAPAALTLNPSPAGERDLPESQKVIGELPTFDFSLLSWGESRQIDRVKKRLEATSKDDLDEMDAAILAFQDHVCKVLIDVPRSWLVRTAPDVIDWAKGASLDWLQKNKFQALVNAWNEAQAFDAASGG